MAEPLKEFFSSSSIPIDLVIFDPFVYITAKFARQRQIPVHAFITSNLLSIPRFVDISIGKDESPVITRTFAQQIVESLSLSDGIICNSIYELDKTILNHMHNNSLLNSSVPIRFVAPIISQSTEHQTTEHIQKWLDNQRNSSSNQLPFIIYISFGSLAVLNCSCSSKLFRYLVIEKSFTIVSSINIHR